VLPPAQHLLHKGSGNKWPNEKCEDQEKSDSIN
jgi:hypothetical protein